MTRIVLIVTERITRIIHDTTPRMAAQASSWALKALSKCVSKKRKRASSEADWSNDVGQHYKNDGDDDDQKKADRARRVRAMTQPVSGKYDIEGGATEPNVAALLWYLTRSDRSTMDPMEINLYMLPLLRARTSMST